MKGCLPLVAFFSMISVADPDPTYYLDADPDPACHFEADPDPDPSFQIKALKTLKMCSNRLIYQTFWLVIRKLTRIQIRIPLITRRRIRIQLINLMRIRIQILPLNLMQIQADPDQQYCQWPKTPSLYALYSTDRKWIDFENKMAANYRDKRSPAPQHQSIPPTFSWSLTYLTSR